VPAARLPRLILTALLLAGMAAGSHWLITRAQADAGLASAVHGLFLAQHAGVHAALAVGFGLTLRRGHLPLISRLAERVHGHLTPAMARYTRQVTQAWVLHFAAMAALSVALFAAGRIEAWSLLVNVGTPVATLAMFAGEYLLRYRLHPEFERVSLAESVRAWRAHQAGPQAGRTGGPR
jgi:uncharacterized membrane protein